MTKITVRPLGETALSMLCVTAFADGLDPTIQAQGAVMGQMSQLATVSGTTAPGAYALSPEWSEEP